jgi:hypothetical protein
MEVPTFPRVDPVLKNADSLPPVFGGYCPKALKLTTRSECAVPSIGVGPTNQLNIEGPLVGVNIGL